MPPVAGADTAPLPHPRAAAAFRWVLLGSVAAGIWLVRPFLDVLIAAAVVSVLAWPLREWAAHRLPGRPRLATALVSATVAVGTLVPAAGILVLVGRHLGGLLQRAAEGQGWQEGLRHLAQHPLLTRWFGEPGAVADLLGEATREGGLALAQAVTGSVPRILSVTTGAVLKTTVFVLAVVTLFHRGAEFRAWALRVSPLETRHTRRLFEVFSEFARNVVLAGLITGVLQGLASGVGYLLAGVESPLVFAILTGVMAYVPIVGTALVWIPLALLLLAAGRVGDAVLLIAWSAVVTTSVDNLVKPILVKGQSQFPTLLVFLGVFGGLRGFGLIGVLVGPVLVAMILALLRFQEELAVRRDPG